MEKKFVPEVDLRQFRPGKLNAPEFQHLKLLLYWPVFGLLFFGVERLWIRQEYYPMHCPLDPLIPFCEWFVFPYLFWFVFLIGIHLYAAVYDAAAFRRLMKFVMLTYTAALVIFILFPNCQEMRPAVFPRDNALTRFMAGFYRFDTSTNVCPSLHVVGSVAVMLCAWDSKDFSTPGWKLAFGVTAFLISISTVFLKQHSLLDVLAAIPLCLTGYVLVYGRAPQREPLPRPARRGRLRRGKASL